MHLVLLKAISEPVHHHQLISRRKVLLICNYAACHLHRGGIVIVCFCNRRRSSCLCCITHMLFGKFGLLLRHQKILTFALQRKSMGFSDFLTMQSLYPYSLMAILKASTLGYTYESTDVTAQVRIL